jgi:AraC-like DNA-binding protein
MLTAGAFELRDAHGKHVVDVTRALLMPAGHPFTIRHPAGPDVCVALRGGLVDRLVDRIVDGRARLVPVAAARVARAMAELAAFRRGATGGARERGGAGVTGGDELALAEAVVALFEPDGAAARVGDGKPTTPAERAIAEALVHRLRLSFAASTSLGELADATGYSVFHACRAFRAVTGTTIHGYRRELRLRHALARMLDGDEPLAAIAAETGFASQSHLTNLFRARFGVTPAKARTRAGMHALAARAA